MEAAEKDILLAELKNRLDITWACDEATDNKLLLILEGCMDGLRKRAGNPNLVFEGEVRSLLFDFCRYDYNNRREEFDGAFRGDLVRLRLLEGFDCGKPATEL